MSLKKKIEDKLNEALKAKDKNTYPTLRLIVSAIKDAEIAGRSKGLKEIKDSDITSLLKKMIKQRNLTIETFKSANRLDLAEKEKIEADLLSVYLPKQLTESELKNIIIAIVKETAAESIRDMSKVMKVLKEKYGDKCDLQLASKIVKDKLSNNEI